MITWSGQQMTALQKAQRAKADAAVADFIRETQPDSTLEVPAGRLDELARLWVEQSLAWGITTVPLMCELLKLRARWGAFDDPDSSWIVTVLEGPLSEHDKVDYLALVMYGG